MAAIRRIELTIPETPGRGKPLALPVFTRARIGPKVLPSGLPGDSKQLWIRPTKEILKLASVLPMGVLQQLEYQRRSPLSVRRMHARDPEPEVKLTFMGRV